MLTTTETLLKGLAAGNDGRWARFYREYAPFLEAFIAKRYSTLSAADAEDVISETMIAIAKLMPTYTYDKEKKGAFHSLLFKIAQNKAYDRATRQTREEEKLREFDARPLSLSPDDWRLATYDAALRRVMADPSVLETTKIAFRRYVQLGEAAEKVASDLNLSVNALYQIRDRMKKRLTEEVRKLQDEFPDGL